MSDAIDNDPEANYDMMKKFDLASSWSAFAGMGAVWFWNEDWNDLRDTGIIEKLSAPEGVDCLDDVVLDAVGMGRMTEESKEYIEFLHAMSIVAFKHISGVGKEDPKAIISALRERNKAMFMFGIAVEMHRLGMN